MLPSAFVSPLPLRPQVQSAIHRTSICSSVSVSTPPCRFAISVMTNPRSPPTDDSENDSQTLTPIDTTNSSSGNTSSPSDPQESAIADPVAPSSPPSSSAGIASDDDILYDGMTYDDDVLSDDDILLKPEPSQKRQMPKNPDVIPDFESDLSTEAEEPAKPVTIDLTDEQKEEAKVAREKAVEAANSEKEQIAARNLKVRKIVEKVLQFMGEKSRVFELGQTARAKSEIFVEDAIAASEDTNATLQMQLNSSAASTAKSLIASLVTIWNARAVPFVCKQLPDEFSDLSGRAVASTALGLFVAISLLPSLFSGGPSLSKQKSAEVKEFERETASLEKKLNRSRTSSYSSISRSPDFLPDDEPVTSPKPYVRPSAPLPPVVATKPVPPPPPASPVRIEDATLDMTLSAVRNNLGTNAALVLSASFDSSYAEPTVALQVSKAFHNLPKTEQRRVAEMALEACWGMSYERVTFNEVGTLRQVAQAVIDVDLVP